jgi:hypothetical protein
MDKGDKDSLVLPIYAFFYGEDDQDIRKEGRGGLKRLTIDAES